MNLNIKIKKLDNNETFENLVGVFNRVFSLACYWAIDKTQYVTYYGERYQITKK